MYICTEPRSVDECIDGLKEELNQKIIYRSKISFGSTTLFWLLRDYPAIKVLSTLHTQEPNAWFSLLHNDLFDNDHDMQYLLRKTDHKLASRRHNIKVGAHIRTPFEKAQASRNKSN